MKWTILLVLASACSSSGNPGPTSGDDVVTGDDAPDAGTTPTDPVAPELGDGDHTAASVDLVVVASAPALARPMDLKVDPVNGVIWIVNQSDDSWTLVNGTTTSRFFDDSNHFLKKPASLSFAGNGERVLATCQESTNGGDGFMGPVAWTSDTAKFEGGTASHYDMLHESNNCMGIAWQTGHVFWVFNGTNSVIDRVDFHGWHPDAPGGLGGHDHSDGEYFRYPDAQVRRVAGVVSSMQFDPSDGMLYVADTGNGRVARMPTNGAIGARMNSNFEEVPMYRAAGSLTDVIAPGVVARPSGLIVKDGLIYVSDAMTGIIYAFDKTGKKVNWLDTGFGATHVGSIAIKDGHLYFLDTPSNKLVRIDPK